VLLDALLYGSREMRKMFLQGLKPW
jgi:hypothetical protein